MNVYISSHSPEEARKLAEFLEENGSILVVSDWHCTNDRPPPHAAVDWERNAFRNFALIERADALVLIAGPDKYTGGKFVEAGYALGAGVPVCILGRIENGMLWATETNQDDTYEELLETLENL